MTKTSTWRSPQEVFADHTQRLATGNLDFVVENYTKDAVFLTPAGVLHGRPGVKSGLAALIEAVPEAKWELTTKFAGDILLLTWSATSAQTRIRDGVDTFVFRNGQISAQTVHYTVESSHPETGLWA
ncbi:MULTISPECIES: nuclear transport factor 2 family protein [unclassified Pseudarthrobacter]|uniref:nuclear transport factor 2 family protein n=1 Tax=unclassified Pseudarthrobacter TaxID=2647000 RepID=UPI0030784A56